MRKIYFVFGAVASMALISGMVACSGDDDDNTQPGVDSGTPDTSVIVTDSGPEKDGSTPPVDAGPCVKCKELVQGKGALKDACPASIKLAFEIIACGCDKTATGAAGEGKCDVDSGTMSGDGGAGACGAFCASPTTTLPDTACIGCGASQCTAQFGACFADTNEPPADAGTHDAGDGGDAAP